MKPRKLIIVGDSAFAQIAYEYFTYDSDYEVAAFSVERDFLKQPQLFGLPVIPLEELNANFSPEDHHFFAAIAYADRNRLRARLYTQTKAQGFRAASYLSSRAFIWRNARIGEHSFIFEDNVIQPFVSVGCNVVMWSGNHIGHHSTIGSNCFFSSHVVISGFVNVGEACFLGVNSTVVNNVSIGNNCLIAAGATVLRDVDDNRTVIGTWSGRDRAKVPGVAPEV